MSKSNNKKKIKYDLNQYAVPDHVRVTFKFCVGFNSVNAPSFRPKLGDFNRHGHVHLKQGEPSRGKVMRKKKYDIVTRSLSLSCGRKLRELVLLRLNLKRMPRVMWEQGGNCLSVELLNMLKEKNVKFVDLKAELYHWVDDQVLNAIFEMVGDYEQQFLCNVNVMKVEVWIKKAEICNDVKGSVNCELTKDRQYIRRFNEVIHNSEVSHYIDNKKHALPPARTGVDTKSGAACRKQIRGFNADRSVLKTYLKSISKQGSLNRIETQFKEAALDYILGDRGLSPLALNGIRLSDQLEKLSKIHIRRTYKILAFRPLSQKPELKKLLRRAINDYCEKYSLDIRKRYFSWGVLSTKAGSLLTEGAKRKVRNLAAKNILFKKTAATEYEIDYNWFRKLYY